MGAQASKERQPASTASSHGAQKRSSFLCCFSSNPEATQTPSGSPATSIRTIVRPPVAALQAASTAPLAVPVLDVFKATRDIIASHFQPPIIQHQQLQHVGSMHADRCLSSTSFEPTLDTAPSTPNSCMSPCTETSLLAGHSHDDLLSPDCSGECALTSCMVTATSHAARHTQQQMNAACKAEKLIGLSELATPVSTAAADSACRPQPVRTPAGQLSTASITHRPASSKSRPRPCIVIPEPPSPPAVAIFEVEPGLVAGLLLMHSQGRHMKVLPASSMGFYQRRETQLLGLWHHPLGMCQLPGHVIHWLAGECGYNAYGRPPKPTQLSDMRESIYFAAAFCQVVGSFLRGLGKSLDTSLLGPLHPVLQTAQRIACSTYYTDDDDDHVSGHVLSPPSPASYPASSPGGAYGSGIVLQHQPYISAMWPDSPAGRINAAAGAATTAVATGAGSGAVTAPSVPSPWFDMHALPQLPHFDHQDIATYTHVIVCTYHLHASSSTPPAAHSPITAPSDQLQLRMAWAQYAASESHLARLHTALLRRETVQKGEEPLTMYMVGAGDTLASIAAAAQVTEEALLLANPGLCNEPTLRPHDCLALPVASVIPKLYCLQPGDTLCSTATKHAVSLHKLLQCNTQLRKLNPHAPLPGWLVELPDLYGHI